MIEGTLSHAITTPFAAPMARPIASVAAMIQAAKSNPQAQARR